MLIKSFQYKLNQQSTLPPPPLNSSQPLPIASSLSTLTLAATPSSSVGQYLYDVQGGSVFDRNSALTDIGRNISAKNVSAEFAFFQQFGQLAFFGQKSLLSAKIYLSWP